MTAPFAICPFVFANIAPGSEFARAMPEVLRCLAIDYDVFFTGSRLEVGTRETMIPGFLIASHGPSAMHPSGATDRGYLRRYFTGLKLISL